MARRPRRQDQQGNKPFLEFEVPQVRRGSFWSREEVRVQEDAVEQLLLHAVSPAKIVERLGKPAPQGMGLTRTRVVRLVRRVRERWEDEDRRTGAREEHRSKALRRVLGYIQQAAGRRGKADPNDPASPVVWLEKPNHSALARYESLLADFTGIRAPAEVNLNLEAGAAVAAVFSGYSLGKLKRMHAEAEREHQLAEAYRREHPELPPAIDVQGEVAE